MSDSRERHPKRSDQEWISLIKECRTSGQTDRDWCYEHRISTSKFYYHIRRLRAKACELPANPQALARASSQEIVKIDFPIDNPLEIIETSESAVSSIPSGTSIVIPSFTSEKTAVPATGFSSAVQVELPVTQAVPAIRLSFCGCSIEILNSAERGTIADTLSVLQSLC